MGEKTQKVKSLKFNRNFSAGGVIFKKETGQILWLVTRATPSKLYPETVWRLPKGWIDDEDSGKIPGPISRGEKKATEEDLQKTALREVKEEGGIEAKIIGKIGTSKYFTNYFTNLGQRRILKFATYYLMEWLKDLSEGFGVETVEIVWLPYEEAYQKLTHIREKQILKKAQDLV